MCNCIGTLSANGLARWVQVSDLSADLTMVPRTPGVYVLRVSDRTESSVTELRQTYSAEVAQLHEYKTQFFDKCGLTWIPDRNLKFVAGRLERLSRIERSDWCSCSLIYIGSSKNIRRRLEQLLCKEEEHTIAHPLRALLLAGWQVECASRTTSSYLEEEQQLKATYKAQHSGYLPPLVDR